MAAAQTKTRTRTRKKSRRRTKAYHHGNLPVALRDVGLELIGERGADGFTLREVARRVGVTHVAAYRHYADRRALLAAVAEHGFQRLRTRLEAARRKTPPTLEPRLHALLAAYLQFCWKEPALTAVMFGPRLSSADAMGRYLTKMFSLWRMHWSPREVFPFDRGDGSAFLWHATLTPAGASTSVEIDGMDLAVLEGERLKRNEVYFDRVVLASLLGSR